MRSANNVKVKVVLLFSLFGILLVMSTPIISSVFVDLTSSSAPMSMSSTAKVFVDPVNILNESLQAGSTFTVNVNVSDVTDLFTWQVNMTWNSSILDVNGIFAGEFLNQTTSANKTSSAPRYFGGLGFVINVTDNAKGYTVMTESILEDVLPSDVPGISGNGTLVSVEFLVLDYGATDLNISASGSLPTMLLDSADGTITYDEIDGYFSNKILGDIEGDGDVDFDDFILFAGAYGTSVGEPTYNPEADLDGDGDVDFDDFIIFAGNYGRSI